eukprot:CAMPEP_0177764830 /NCGR_PEP_ID=MMETSP0491_2-20121128/7632_1 /TAXON_ID=63592 /ORGANISM="Tetraselmis chuii, Strain PLY429" /LENGTH=410 /DNA_ID=CAMNT_0019281067 /DNA_START=407 /DNA_END=1639 /DNA_ORIENTATION=+
MAPKEDTTSGAAAPAEVVKEKRKRVKRKLPLECRVEGCGVDLAPLKALSKTDYRVRYKICDEHLKAPEVFTMGKKMRFCQQCTSLHELERFDGAKRSCKNRLNTHNTRRRKKRLPPAHGAAPALPAPGVAGLDALSQLFANGGGGTGGMNSSMMSSLYELLNGGGSAPPTPASAAPASNNALLRSAADMLGSMGASGVQGAVAALQAVASTPKPQPVSAPPSTAQQQQQHHHSAAGGGMGIEALAELLGAYNQVVANQASHQQAANLVSLLSAVTANKPAPAPRAPSPPPPATTPMDTSQLTSYLSNLAGPGSGGGLFSQTHGGSGIGGLAGLLGQLQQQAAPPPQPLPPPQGQGQEALLQLLGNLGGGGGGNSGGGSSGGGGGLGNLNLSGPAASALAQQLGALLGGMN